MWYTRAATYYMYLAWCPNLRCCYHQSGKLRAKSIFWVPTVSPSLPDGGGPDGGRTVDEQSGGTRHILSVATVSPNLSAGGSDGGTMSMRPSGAAGSRRPQSAKRPRRLHASRSPFTLAACFTSIILGARPWSFVHAASSATVVSTTPSGVDSPATG